MKHHDYYVYFITNWTGERLYIGVTNNLDRRMCEHKNKLIKGFTSKYNIDKLVYYEHISDINAAIQREKQLKAFRRDKKDKLVTAFNPEWLDLYETLFQ